MRISTQMIQQGALRSLRRGTASLAKAQQEAVSGRRVQSVSDDPVDAGQIMRLDAQLRDISRFQRNGTWATTRMSVEDAVITNLRELLQKAQKLGTAAASLPAGDPVRQATIVDLQNLKTEILSLANTKVGSEFLFAGGNSTSPAFLPDGTYASDSTARSTEINAGVTIRTNDTGDVIFGDSLAAVDGLLAQLQTGDAAGIQAATGAISSASVRALTVQTTLGARLSEIQDVATALARTAVRVADQRDQLRNVDPAEAAVKLSTAQTALQQAYAVVSKVLSINLIDYLK
jgi:flagellar hook-associated protein 3 FlgL